MENQNMTTEVKIAEINNMILRRIDALKELLKMQNKTIKSEPTDPLLNISIDVRSSRVAT